MNYLRRRIVLASVVFLLIASSVPAQQRGMAVFSASGTPEAILKVQAFENDRHFIIRAIGDAAVKGQTKASFSIEIRVTDDDPSAKNFIAYGCEEKNTAKFDDGIGRLHVETSCEIVVTAKKMVAVTAKADSRSSAKPENITLEATSSW